MKCPYQNFENIKNDALKSYSENMEKIHTKLNKEPKILD